MPETIALFGGTGGTGSEILAAALDQGYLVRALVRTPSKVTIEHENLTVFKGDIAATDAVKDTVKGADYVISAVGGPLGKPKDFPVGTIVQFIQDLVEIMKQEPSVKVFLHQSGAFVAHPDGTQPLGMKILGTVVGWLAGLGPNLEENLNIEKYMESVKDEVTFKMICTRPGGLKVGSGGTELAASDDSPPYGMATFKDVAVFTLKAIKDESLYGKYPYVGNA